MGSLLSLYCIPSVYFGHLVVIFFFLIYLVFTHQKKKGKKRKRKQKGRSSNGCGIEAGDDGGMKDDSTRGHVGGRERQVYT